jgi:hypothetical protein
VSRLVSGAEGDDEEDVIVSPDVGDVLKTQTKEYQEL